jgi:RND family efflux transporter MFP subunit
MKSLPILLLLVMMAGCGRNESSTVEAAAGQTAAVRVTVAPAIAEHWPEFYEATGTVRARATTSLSSKVMGYVQQVSANVGDRVAEGQLVITLDSRDLDAAVRRTEAAGVEAQSAAPEVEHAIAAAKAQLDLAQATLKRIEELAGKKSVSNQELDEASARAKAAQASYEMAVSRRAQVQSRIAQVETEQRAARITRDYAVIRAPFDGVVTARSAEPGTLAAPGVPLLTIEKAGAYRLEALVEESKLSMLRTGSRARLEIEGCAVDAPIAEIVPSIDAASRNATVKFDLPCGTVRSGMFGRATFTLGERAVLSLPAPTIVERGQLISVFVEESGMAHARLVTIGRKAGGRAEILSGINPGERAVVSPPASLIDGARIEVRP